MGVASGGWQKENTNKKSYKFELVTTKWRGTNWELLLMLQASWQMGGHFIREYEQLQNKQELKTEKRKYEKKQNDWRHTQTICNSTAKRISSDKRICSGPKRDGGGLRIGAEHSAHKTSAIHMFRFHWVLQSCTHTLAHTYVYMLQFFILSQLAEHLAESNSVFICHAHIKNFI